MLFDSAATVLHPAYEPEKSKKDKMFKALSLCLWELVEMHKKKPLRFKIVMEKLQHPELSYSEIGKKFKCKKQNVLYHLQKAAAEFPELESALLVDQRFNKNAA